MENLSAEHQEYLKFLEDDLDTQTRLAWFAFEYALAVEAEYEGE